MDKDFHKPPSSQETSSHSGLSPGVEIQGFRLESEFAQGGMGVVWKAKQLKTNRTVAFKMILGGISGKSTDKVRFMAESVAMASVKHSHIVEVLEFGDAQGRLFLAMEFMPGGTLADKIRAYNKFDPKAAARILAKICQGVQAAHDRGIIHRDLKPENILFDRNFEPKVTDFGLAKQEEITINTVSYSVLGTPYYMAPEQAEGNSRFVGPQADIYSLGVILYECITGSLPFDGDNPIAVIRKVAEAMPESPRRRVSTISRDVERICLKCLAKAPSERYQSCHDLAEDLHRFINDQPVLAQKSSNLSRLLYWAKRNRALAATAASTVALLLIASIGFAALSFWALTERDNAQKNLTSATNSKLEAEENAKRALAHQDAAESQLYISNVQRALTEWKYGRPQTARERLDESPFERRGWEHHFVHSTVEANQVVLEGHTAEVMAVAYSPDGKWIASASDDHTIKIWDALQGTLVDTLTAHKDYVRSVCFSADGSTMASASRDMTIKIWDVATRNLKKSIDLSGLNPDRYYFGTSLALSQDGQFIAVGRLLGFILIFEIASENKTFIKTTTGGLSNYAFFSHNKKQIFICEGYNSTSQWDIKNNTIIKEFKVDTNHAAVTACLIRDGKRLVIGSADSNLRLWDTESGKLVHTFTGHTDAVTSVAISPDEKWIATGSDDHTIRIWNAETGQFVRVLKGHGHVIRGVSFSPDGKKLVSGSWDKTVRIWDFATDQGPQISKIESEKPRDLNFSPGGKFTIVARGDGKIQIRSDKNDFLTKPKIPNKPVHLFGVSFSPNGKQVVGAGGDWLIHIWDFETRQLLKTLSGHKDAVQSACYTPDGKRIISASDDQTIKIWDASEGTVLKTLDKHKDAVLGVNVSPDGKWFASASADKTIKVWDAKDYSLKWDLLDSTNTVRCVGFSPDSKRLVSGDIDKIIRIWNLETGALLQTLKGHIDGITRVSYSPDGKRILSSSFDNSLKLWDADTGAEILTLAQHTASVRSARFSPDGKTIASVGDDGQLIVWDGSDRREQMVLRGHDGTVTQAGFSPDERYIISKDDRGIIKIWDPKNGNKLSDPALEFLKHPATPHPAHSKDGKWAIETSGPDVFLIDTQARIARKTRDKNRLKDWSTKSPGEAK